MALLRELRAEVNDAGKARIDRVLSAVSSDVADAAAAVDKSPNKQPFVGSEAEEEQGEANVSAEFVNSTDLDLIDENLLQDEQTRATGFIGKSSEIQWLRQLQPHDVSTMEGPFGPPGETIEAANERIAALRQRQARSNRGFMHTNKASYYLDDELLELDLEVDAYELPPLQDAEQLVRIYMDTCHNSFPVIAKKAFMDQFYTCEPPR